MYNPNSNILSEKSRDNNKDIGIYKQEFLVWSTRCKPKNN